jgi:hypothetical protein
MNGISKLTLACLSCGNTVILTICRTQNREVPWAAEDCAFLINHRVVKTFGGVKV